MFFSPQINTWNIYPKKKTYLILMQIRISIEQRFYGTWVTIHRKSIYFSVWVNHKQILCYLYWVYFIISFVVANQMNFAFDCLKLGNKTFGLCLNMNENGISPSRYWAIRKLLLQFKRQGINKGECIWWSLIIQKTIFLR